MHLFFCAQHTVKSIFCTIALTLALSQLCHLSAAEIFGKVVGVSDGDTITLLDTSNSRHRIRLDRVDAPERRQPFGEKSKRFLASLVFGQCVRVEYEKKDRYGRILGTVFLGDEEINLTMVRHGMAWHYSFYDKTERYAVAEREARQKKIGLWRDPDPMNPYDFRRSRKKFR